MQLLCTLFLSRTRLHSHLHMKAVWDSLLLSGFANSMMESMCSQLKVFMQYSDLFCCYFYCSSFVNLPFLFNKEMLEQIIASPK